MGELNAERSLLPETVFSGDTDDAILQDTRTLFPDRLRRTEADIRSLFHKYDADMSGFLEKDEMAVLIRDLAMVDNTSGSV